MIGIKTVASLPEDCTQCPCINDEYWFCQALLGLREPSTKHRPDQCPLVEVSEPKHGHWIDKGWNGDWQFQTDGRGNCWHEWECSECGFITKGAKWNFCPNCGSQMNKAEE